VRSIVKPPADPELLVPTVHNLAMAYAAQGRFREASTELRAALAQVRGTSSPRAPLYLSNLALLLSLLGELAEARKAAEEGLAAAQRFSNRAQEATCQEVLARIQVESGDLDGALAALRRAEEINAELRMELIAADLLVMRGKIFCARGEYRRAVEFLTEAVERLASRPDDPRRVDFKATLAWCELRAGRVREAKTLLASLLPRADADENDHTRMRVHYWLGESLLALGEPRAADEHLGIALKLVGERGYLYFLRAQAREEPAPLLRALARGIEVTTVSGALVDAGATVEAALLKILEDAPTAAGEAALSVLAEVGGQASREALEPLAKRRRALKPAIQTALKHIVERSERGAARDLETEEQPARLTLFGPPQLEAGGRVVPASAWRAQRAFHKLVFLSLHPRGASRDELIERFWPGRQAAAGRRNFHPTLSYIRSVLPRAAAPILREGEFYRLNPAYPLATDAWELERVMEEARRGRNEAARRAALRHAAALATGPFLQGLYMDWADELQARMRDRVEKLLLELGGLCAQAGDFDEALEHFRRAVELDEYREGTRLMVIECLVRVGNRRAALAEYDRMKAVLKRELDVDPLEETETAVRQLLDGKGVHGWPETGPLGTLESDEAQEVMASSQVRLKAAARGSRP
jgi:DNA-binding SARP family transcriptional activator